MIDHVLEKPSAGISATSFRKKTTRLEKTSKWTSRVRAAHLDQLPDEDNHTRLMKKLKNAWFMNLANVDHVGTQKSKSVILQERFVVKLR